MFQIFFDVVKTTFITIWGFVISIFSFLRLDVIWAIDINTIEEVLTLYADLLTSMGGILVVIGTIIYLRLQIIKIKIDIKNKLNGGK